jgi:tetratricopeptide (TPR) repeat protein
LALLAVAGRAAAEPPCCLLTPPPADAIRKLAKLDGRIHGPSKEELALFEDARGGRFERHTLAEACLLACGVSDPRDRCCCCDKLDGVEKAAREATAGSRSAAEVAEKLLRFLHAGPMANGFRSDQTDLRCLVDSGKFNCVSSAALYTVIGRRLGLDVRAVEVPEHMFVVVSAGGRPIEVEPTDPGGFDADPGRRVGPARARAAEGRRAVSEAGLAAVMAYNRGVAFSQQKQYAQAARAGLVALALDPANSRAAQNTAAAVANWPVERVHTGEFKEAAALVAFGLEVAPKDPAVRNNARAVFDAWADVSMRRGDWSEAVRVYALGLEQLPGDEHLTGNLGYCRDRIGK